jgi:hypothetical protein
MMGSHNCVVITKCQTVMFSDPRLLARAFVLALKELPQTPHPLTSLHPFLESAALLGKHGGIFPAWVLINQ